MTEFQIHIAVVQHLRIRSVRGWRWTHPANGELRDKRTAAKLSAMGLEPGWADLILCSPAGMLHSLELKRPGGSLSPSQKAFRIHCEAYGWPYVVADSVDAAVAALEDWGAIHPQAVAHA